MTLSILILKKKHSFQLAYSSIGIGNKLGVFTDLHFRFVFCFLFLCLFRLLHGLLLECQPYQVFVLSFLLNFSLVVLVLFLFTATALHFTLFLFVLLNFYFFRFLQNAMEWSEWTHLILFCFCFCFFFKEVRFSGCGWKLKYWIDQ